MLPIAQNEILPRGAELLDTALFSMVVFIKPQPHSLIFFQRFDTSWYEEFESD